MYVKTATPIYTPHIHTNTEGGREVHAHRASSIQEAHGVMEMLVLLLLVVVVGTTDRGKENVAWPPTHTQEHASVCACASLPQLRLVGAGDEQPRALVKKRVCVCVCLSKHGESLIRKQVLWLWFPCNLLPKPLSASLSWSAPPQLSARAQKGRKTMKATHAYVSAKWRRGVRT